MARLGLVLAAAALLLASCPRHAAAQTWSGKGKQQVVTTPIVSSGKGDASVPHTQVVRQCDDVCKDECTQQVDTKCEKVPYQEQVCTDKAYSDSTTSCTKKCTAVVAPAPMVAAAQPVPTNDMPVTVVGSGATYGGKGVAAGAPISGRKLKEVGIRESLGRKLKGTKKTKGGGVAYAYQPQLAYVPQYYVAAPTQYYVVQQPQNTYVAAAPADVVCNDECVTIPVMRYANECQLVQKEREVCTDYITTTCKKVCKPECREYTQQVAVASAGKGR